MGTRIKSAFFLSFFREKIVGKSTKVYFSFPPTGVRRALLIIQEYSRRDGKKSSQEVATSLSRQQHECANKLIPFISSSRFLFLHKYTIYQYFHMSSGHRRSLPIQATPFFIIKKANLTTCLDFAASEKTGWGNRNLYVREMIILGRKEKQFLTNQTNRSAALHSRVRRENIFLPKPRTSVGIFRILRVRPI